MLGNVPFTAQSNPPPVLLEHMFPVRSMVYGMFQVCSVVYGIAHRRQCQPGTGNVAHVLEGGWAGGVMGWRTTTTVAERHVDSGQGRLKNFLRTTDLRV